MYNAKQKEQFLSTISNENTYKTYITSFNKVEEVETTLGKDVADMSLEEVLTVLDVSSGKSVFSARTHRSLLEKYVDWCIRNGKSVLGENNFSKISSNAIDTSQSFRESHVGSGEEMEEIFKNSLYAEQYFNESEMDDIRELVVRLLYEGMERGEIQALEICHIDFDNHMIHSPLYDCIDYQVSDRILELAKKCYEMTEIGFARGNNSVAKLQLCQNDHIIRPRVSKYRPKDYDGGVSNNFIWKKVNEINTRYAEETGNYKNLTESTVADSKKYYDYYKSGESDEFIDGLKVDIKLRKPKKTDAQLSRDIMGFKNDYQTWKKVFH